MITWRAVLKKDNPWDQGIRLHVFRHHADGHLDVLLSDGWLQTVPEAAMPPENAGLMIPEDALEAIAEVFHPHATGQARLEGEIKVLREALARAESRVELMIDKALEDH